MSGTKLEVAFAAIEQARLNKEKEFLGLDLHKEKCAYDIYKSAGDTVAASICRIEIQAIETKILVIESCITTFEEIIKL